MAGNFREMLKRFSQGKRNSYVSGEWKIAVGGYDEWFEIYKNDIPVINCVDGRLNVCYNFDTEKNIKKYLDTIVEVIPNVHID